MIAYTHTVTGSCVACTSETTESASMKGNAREEPREGEAGRDRQGEADREGEEAGAIEVEDDVRGPPPAVMTGAGGAADAAEENRGRDLVPRPRMKRREKGKR